MTDQPPAVCPAATWSGLSFCTTCPTPEPGQACARNPDELLRRATAEADPADLTGYLAPDPPIGCLTGTAEHPSEPKPVGTGGDWPSRRAGLRDDIALAIHRYDREHLLSRSNIPSKHHRGEADAVLALLYRKWPWLQAEAEESSRPAPTACGHGPELDRLNAELADYDKRAEQQKLRAEAAEQHLRNIAQGGPRADAVQAEIGEMIAQTHELRDQLRRAEAAIERARTLAARWENALAPDHAYARSLHAALDDPQDRP